MQTADYALLVSLLSLVVSLGSFVWNVWSKFIYPKGKVRVAFAMSILFDGDSKFDVISANAVNYGPSETTLHSIVCRSKKPWSWWFFSRQWQYGLLNPLHNFPLQLEYTIGPFGGGLPKKLEVGESFTIYLAARHDALANDPIVDVGFCDVFGRYHWAPRYAVRRVREDALKKLSES